MTTPVDPPLPRAQFPVTEHLTFLNHAGVAPIPTAAVAALAEYATRVAHGGSTETEVAMIEPVRDTAARLMGVPSDDVAFVKNTTEGIGFVANGIAWRPGDRVLVPNFEFPSNFYPWIALRERDVLVDVIEPVGTARALPLELFDTALRAAPARLVAVSWVQFGRGYRIDVAGLAALCHDHGALLCLDAIQGLGVLPAGLAAADVDFATADAHKWLLGPEGVGVFYAHPRTRDLLRPLEPGWASVAHREEWDNLDLVYDPSARRYEGGSFNHAGIAALGASVDLLLGAGAENIWSHVDMLCEQLVAGLTRAGVTVLTDRAASRSGIVTFAPPHGDADMLCQRLLERDIVVSPRGGGVRVSPHGYNTADEIDTLVAAVAHLA